MENAHTQNYSNLNSYKDPKEYILKHYKEWSFKNFLEQDNLQGNALYFLVFDTNFGCITLDFSDSSLFLNEKEKCYLCKDGVIRLLSPKDLSVAYCVSDREKMIRTMNACQKYIDNICKNNGFDTIITKILEIELKQNKKPMYLFTEEEISLLLKNGDDQQNNILVVDEYGYVNLIQDISIAYTYPVRYETFIARNGYVGENSGEETAYNSYLSLLYGWLNYLKTNVSQFIDYPISENKDILVKNIKKYYD